MDPLLESLFGPLLEEPNLGLCTNVSTMASGVVQRFDSIGLDGWYRLALLPISFSS